MSRKLTMPTAIGCVLLMCWSVDQSQGAAPSGQPEANTATDSLTMAERLRAVSPVFDSFAEALARIAHKYPEMAEYQKEKAKGQAEDVIWCGHSHNFTKPTVKRGILPSDFGDNGFTVSLSCKAMPPPDRVYAMSPPALEMKNLRFYVWTEVRTAPNPSAGLIEEVNTIIQAHLARLKAIDEAASNKAMNTDK